MPQLVTSGAAAIMLVCLGALSAQPLATTCFEVNLN